MKHSIQVADDEISVIEIPKILKCEIEIYNQSINDTCHINLSIDQLHSFIGTLLHVQAKLKNR